MRVQESLYEWIKWTKIRREKNFKQYIREWVKVSEDGGHEVSSLTWTSSICKSKFSLKVLHTISLIVWLNPGLGSPTT